MTIRHVMLVALALAGAGVLNACSQPPTEAPQRPAVESRDRFPAKLSAQSIDCQTPGATAEFTNSTRANPPTIELTYRGARPTSKAAEEGLRRCVAVALAASPIQEEMLARAWWSAAGTDSDDDPIPLADGESVLSVSPSGEVRGWKARQGESALVKDNHDGSYFTEFTVKKTAVTPVKEFATLDVVFQSSPSIEHARVVLVAEMQTALQRRSDIPITGYAHYGPKADRAGRTQVGKPGDYLYVNFKPGDDQLRSDNGQAVGPVVKR